MCFQTKCQWYKGCFCNATPLTELQPELNHLWFQIRKFDVRKTWSNQDIQLSIWVLDKLNTNDLALRVFIGFCLMYPHQLNGNLVPWKVRAKDMVRRGKAPVTEGSTNHPDCQMAPDLFFTLVKWGKSPGQSSQWYCEKWYLYTTGDQVCQPQHLE